MLQRLVVVGFAISVCTAPLGLTGCGSLVDSGAPECVDERTVLEGPQQVALKAAEEPVSKVFYGTLEPLYMPLSAGQKLAIGNFDICTGTLIAPTWVVTAEHCQLSADAQFCMGEEPDNPSHCTEIVQVVNHPTADLALVELKRDLSAELPELKPIPIIAEALDATWVGRRAEAAGYGQTESGEFGTRYFTAEPIVDVQAGFLTLDGQNMRGVCFGDSGGPALVIAGDGCVRVAGTLSNGEDTCVGLDNFTRLDVHRSWIESFTGPMPAAGSCRCGDISAQGRCAGGRAIWCRTDAVLTTDTCAVGTTCGWDENASGYRCIAGPDACQGLDEFGTCAGNVVQWCEDGVPLSRDCHSCGQICDPVASPSGAHCVPDDCRSLGYLGRCNGDVAEWCDNGQLRQRDCSVEGTSCGYVDEQLGYYCL